MSKPKKVTAKFEQSVFVEMKNNAPTVSVYFGKGRYTSLTEFTGEFVELDVELDAVTAKTINLVVPKGCKVTVRESEFFIPV